MKVAATGLGSAYRQFASLGTTFVTMFRITSFENMSADSAAYFA